MSCDGRGTPLKVITTAANVNHVTQTLALVDGIPPVAGRPSRPRCSATRATTPTQTARNCASAGTCRSSPARAPPNIKGLSKLRYVVEQTVALIHQFKRLALRWERRTELHDAFFSLACGLNCWRRLQKPKNG
ncbi:hypothetical protein [Streptomyces sp. NPDC058108]|uniref:hypothetical protein n=1 Tax=Streptomyces sp. NPDC058108 TaxID=3346344 RepID=UPI0036E3AC9F